jgi:hypothetical protein
LGWLPIISVRVKELRILLALHLLRMPMDLAMRRIKEAVCFARQGNRARIG